MAFMPPQGPPPSQVPPPPLGPPPSQGPPPPPPTFTPQMQQATISPTAVDPGAISGCRGRYTYMWLRNGDNFWFYPTFVGRNSVSGYRWNGWFWMYAGVDLRQITSFTCF